jgi:hypothetical protein
MSYTWIDAAVPGRPLQCCEWHRWYWCCRVVPVLSGGVRVG